jgi:uncharacterized membrane protein YfcA
MGIGGDALSNLILTLHNVPNHCLVSTAAGVGVLITIAGTLGCLAAACGRADLPPDALGFVSQATFGLTIRTSLLTTRCGAKLAHRLTRRHLEAVFGLFIAAVCLRSLWEILLS